MEPQPPQLPETEFTPGQVDSDRRAILVAGGVGVVLTACGAGSVFLDRWLHTPRHSEMDPVNPPGVAISPSETASAPDELSVPPEFDKSKEVDAIRAGVWNYMAGVRAHPAGGLNVFPPGRTLRPDIGTDTYATPEQAIPVTTVNEYGTHVHVKAGDFGIAVRMSSIGDNEASIVFNARPDVVFDERVERAPRLEVAIAEGVLTATVWSEGGEEALEPLQIALNNEDGTSDFWIEQTRNQVVVGSGNDRIGFAADLFKASGNVWFGFGSKNGPGFRVNEIKAYPADTMSEVSLVDTSKLQLGAPQPAGLQAIANQNRPDMTIGTTFGDLGPIAQYPQLAELVGEQVGSIKPERLGKMQSILPGGPDYDGSLRSDDFRWGELDAFVDLAQRNGKRVHMHTLIFGEALSPRTEQFLKDVAEGIASRSAAETFVKTYITAVVSRYKDRIKEWDVVNEPLADAEAFDLKAGRVYRQNAWYKAFGGTDYVRVACEAAKRAGAETVIVNDYGMETDGDRAQAMLDLTAELRRQGYVDAIGFQGHIDDKIGSDIEAWSKDGDLQEPYVFDGMTQRFKQFGEYKVYISEVSIDSDDAHKQAIVSHGLTRAAMHAPNVKGICWWGLVNGPFQMNAEQGRLANDAPWDWGDGGKPVQKETVGGIQQGLRA